PKPTVAASVRSSRRSSLRQSVEFDLSTADGAAVILRGCDDARVAFSSMGALLVGLVGCGNGPQGDPGPPRPPDPKDDVGPAGRPGPQVKGGRQARPVRAPG